MSATLIETTEGFTPAEVSTTKASLAAEAKLLFKQYEVLFFRARSGQFQGRTFTLADGCEYDVTVTVRLCEMEIRRAMDGGGVGLQASRRDLAAIQEALRGAN